MFCANPSQFQKDLSSDDHLGPAGQGGRAKGSRTEGGAGLGSGYNKSAYQGGHADWVKENIVSNPWFIWLTTCS